MILYLSKTLPIDKTIETELLGSCLPRIMEIEGKWLRTVTEFLWECSKINYGHTILYTRLYYSHQVVKKKKLEIVALKELMNKWHRPSHLIVRRVVRR